MYYILIGLLLIFAIVILISFCSIKNESILTAQYKVDNKIINDNQIILTIYDDECKQNNFLIDANYYHDFDEHPLLEIDYTTSLWHKKGNIKRVYFNDIQIV